MILPARVPRAAIDDLVVGFRQRASGPLELIVSSKDVGVNLREFTSYLQLADRAFGRMATADLYEYSRTPAAQLKVAQFRRGSLETIFSAALESVDAQNLLVLWLLLKYLPHGVRNSVAAYRDYEEARYTRARRQELANIERERLRNVIRADPELQHLTPERVRQIARLLEALYSAERRQLPAAIRFATNYVHRIWLRIGNRDVD